MLTCQEVADYFLILVDREAGDSITQLKLQKLVILHKALVWRFEINHYLRILLKLGNMGQ
jgi:hypothetical protein